MRDPKRIDKFCEMLKVYWHMVPDWRFMQLAWLNTECVFKVLKIFQIMT